MTLKNRYNFDTAGRLSRLLAPAAFLSAGAVGLRYAMRHLVRRPLPQVHGRQMLCGLSKPVEIIRDQWGVPHIYAQNERDLFFAQGFVQAQDRLFQMDVYRRIGLGRLSEIVGPPGLPGDRFARIFGWPRAAAAQVALVDEETQSVAEAFCAGVNAFIEQGKLPLEFSLLFYKPEPWQPYDSAAWGAVLAWALSVNWEIELLRALLVEQLGPQKAADLTPTYQPAYTTILGDSPVGTRLAEAMLEAYDEAMTYLPLGKARSGSEAGSNSWVVNGQRTASGRPALANDPHLPPIFPTFWYQNHLAGGRYHVTGFTMPGIPGVIIGHNEHIAWGVTNAFCDVQDIYVENFHPDDAARYEVNGIWQKATTVTEVIRVRGQKPLRLKVRYTRHGPIISDLIAGEQRALALRWAAHEQSNHLRAALAINRASDWQSFRSALRHWGFPSQNLVYADVEGNIGYVMPGLVPIRANGAGLLPVPGWTDGYEWTGWIPADELPAGYNPPKGVIVTANNRVVGDGYPHMLTGEWLPAYRANRILELLDQAPSLTTADHARIQSDTVSSLARRFLSVALPLLVAAGAADDGADDDVAQHLLQLLQAWQGDMRPDEVAPSLFYGLLVYFIGAVMEQAVGATLAAKLMGKGLIDNFPGNVFNHIACELGLRWLETGAPDWVGDVRPLLRPAFRQMVTRLQRQYGRHPANWRWGNLHRLKLYNPLGRIPGLGRLWRPVSIPVGGDSTTVNLATGPLRLPAEPAQLIASCRIILDVGAWDNSLAALPGGQSGHPASRHYLDAFADWRDGRYHPMPFSREAVERAGENALRLEPG